MENNNNDIINLIDILSGMIGEAWGVPLGADKCIIEREKAIGILEDIKNNLPSCIAEAKRLVVAKDEFIGNAKKEAEAIRKSADEAAQKKMEEQEIYRQAEISARRLITEAEQSAAKMRKEGAEYVAKIMAEAEQRLTGSLVTLQQSQKAVQRAIDPNAELTPVTVSQDAE